MKYVSYEKKYIRMIHLNRRIRVKLRGTLINHVSAVPSHRPSERIGSGSPTLWSFSPPKKALNENAGRQIDRKRSKKKTRRYTVELR